MLTARITATGMAVPDTVATNALLARCMSTSDEWITERTGIRERRVSPDTYRMLLRLAEAADKAACMRDIRNRGLDGCIDSTLTVSDLAVEASRMALKHAGLDALDLDCIVQSSTFPDLAYPGPGCVLQGRLGLTTTPVFNLAQGWAGFVYGLALATEHFGIPPERCFNNIDRYGNTAGASVPICLHEALSEDRIKDGDLVMLVAFGTGFSWGATLLRW